MVPSSLSRTADCILERALGRALSAFRTLDSAHCGGSNSPASAWQARPLRLLALEREVDSLRAARSQYVPVPVPRISREDLKQRLDSGAPVVLVDARLKYPYEHSTVKLPGAVRVLAGSPLPALPQDREIVVYLLRPE